MDKKIRSSFENLSPNEEQKNRMWDEIVKKTEKTGKKSYKMPKMLRLTATFAVVSSFFSQETIKDSVISNISAIKINFFILSLR